MSFTRSSNGHYFAVRLCIFFINLFSFINLIFSATTNATESVLEYSPMSPSYLSGAGSHGYYAGAMPFGYNFGLKHGYPLDPWRQNRYDYWENAELYARSDYYWLIPVAFIIGIGALLLPVFSLFITAMVTTGTINLTAGRKRRSLSADSVRGLRSREALRTLTDLVDKVQSAMKRFGQR